MRTFRVIAVIFGTACLAAGLICTSCCAEAHLPFTPGLDESTPTQTPADISGLDGNLPDSFVNPYSATPEVPDLGPAGPVTPTPTDNTTRGWYYIPNTAHRVPSVASDAPSLLRTYNGRYTGANPDLVYLTFDEGYENGYTPAILDTLARNGVKATFFVTESYIHNNPELVRRMVDEGHVVGNHSSTHPSMPSLADDRVAFAVELTATEDAFREITGHEMTRIFRPPMGEYSPLSLWLTQSLGYETVFWSFAHRDWLVEDQPPVDVTLDRILTGSHPGAIYLLHAVSSSNTTALDDAIAELRAQGYGFGTLGR